MQRDEEIGSEQNGHRERTLVALSPQLVSETLVPVAFPLGLCAPHSNYQN